MGGVGTLSSTSLASCFLFNQSYLSSSSSSAPSTSSASCCTDVYQVRLSNFLCCLTNGSATSLPNRDRRRTSQSTKKQTDRVHMKVVNNKTVVFHIEFKFEQSLSSLWMLLSNLNHHKLPSLSLLLADNPLPSSSMVGHRHRRTEGGGAFGTFC